MYLVYQLKPRAETTDTIIYFATKEYEAAQELLLSIYDAMVEGEIEWAHTQWNLTDEIINLETLRWWCIQRMKEYDIMWVPEV